LSCRTETREPHQSTRQGISVPVITFDFHNTIATCDPWFALEVRNLPWAVATHLDLASTSQVDRHELDSAYARLRGGVIASGEEIDAFDAVFAVLNAQGLTVDRHTVERAVDTLMWEAMAALEPVEGIAETIPYLRDRDCRLGIVSSAVHHQFVDWSLDTLGLLDAFSSIVTSASAGYYKSSPRIYEHALRELNAVPARTVHVGDSLRWDVGGAQRAGMKAIWLDTGRVETGSPVPGQLFVPDLTLSSMVGAGPLIHAFAIEVERLADV
jgi:HAD superfamily hydrolase (TIGR01509 family)